MTQHTKINAQLFLGNNLDLLKQLPDNSVDAIVTDPPYGLGKEPDAAEVLQSWVTTGYHEVEGKGFMGKEWDAFVPQPLFWKEAYRVLKHGGHVLSFFGTRTYDWGVMAMRLAGFEVRDSIQYLYGCLSSDTEILTENGWISYDHFRKNKKGSIFVYDASEDRYYFEQPEKWNEYAIKDTAYRIKSDFTEQIVSRNHRCLVERQGKLLFEFAENLAQEQQASIPFLESLPNMQKSFSGVYKRAGRKKQVLWSKLCWYAHFDNQKIEAPKTTSPKSYDRSSLFCLRQENSEAQLTIKKMFKTNLFKKMQWIFSRTGLENTRIQRQVRLVKRNRGKKSSWQKGGTKSSMERRYYLSKKKGILCFGQDKICEMPSRVYANGEKGWVCNGISAGYGAAVGKTFVENGVRTPHRPQPHEQRHKQSNAFCEQQRTQAIRSGRSYRTTLATIEPIEYQGIIFCPTVSTGAFVARRNGKIFITGNSGFPKSHNISKAIDKMEGAEREVIGKSEYTMPKADNSMGENSYGISGGKLANGTTAERITADITAPATDAAKEWDGWGSALKPAHEPIVLARKPLEKGLSIAENVLKHSTGGLNIDGCRVNFKDEADYEESTTKNQHADFGSKPVTDNVVYGDYSMVKPKNYAPTGRYPANLILAHHPDCECVGTKKVKGQIDKPTNRVEKGNTWNETNSGMRKNLPQNSGGFADENGEETVENWICVEDCPVRMLDEQSGESVSKIGNPRGTYKKGMFANSEFNKVGREYDDFGGASRFYYTAKASKDDRNEGLKGFEAKRSSAYGYEIGLGEKGEGMFKDRNPIKQNFHPTVKPTDLMRYLCRLITPPNGIVLDPFMGSGSTGKAAILEGFQFIGMELDEDYFKIAEARIDKAKRDYFDSIAQLNLF